MKIKFDIPNVMSLNNGEDLHPTEIFVNGDQNLIVRYSNQAGEVKAIYEYKRASANVRWID